MNVHIQDFIWYLFSFLSGMYLGMDLLGYMVGIDLMIGGTNCFKMAALFYILTNKGENKVTLPV